MCFLKYYVIYLKKTHLFPFPGVEWLFKKDVSYFQSKRNSTK